MEFTAVAKNARISPRKARLSATLIRGKRVEDALNSLVF
jgi:ribosomal protein L22